MIIQQHAGIFTIKQMMKKTQQEKRKIFLGFLDVEKAFVMTPRKNYKYWKGYTCLLYTSRCV